MKKILFAALALLGMAGIADAAPIWGTVQIGTSTALTPTLQNGAINISSGNVRNVIASTATVQRALIVQSTTTNATVTNLNVTGTASFPSFSVVAATATNLTATTFNTATGSATSWMTTASTNTNHTFVTQNGSDQSVARSTMTNLTVTNANFTQQQSSMSVANFTASRSTVTFLNVNSFTVNGFQAYALLYSSSVFDTSGSSNTAAAIFVPTKSVITVTPKTSSSRIEITVAGRLSTSLGSTANAYATIFRDGTNLAGGTQPFCDVSGGAASAFISPCMMNLIDLPNTTSPVTYTVYMRGSATGASITWNVTSEVATLTVKEWSY